MASPNLGIIHVASAQNQKEITVNSAVDDLDLALTNVVVEAMPDAHFAVPIADALENMVFRFVGVLTANRTVQLPANRKLYIVQNQTTGSPTSTLSFGTPSSPTGRIANVPAESQEYYVLYCDGVNVDIVSPVTSGVSGVNGVKALGLSYYATLFDSGYLLSFNSILPQVLTLPPTPPTTDWFILVKNTGPGPITIFRNGLLVDTRAQNPIVHQGDSFAIFTDGVNYFTEGPRPNDFIMFAPGTMSNAQVLLYAKMTRPVIFPANAPNSLALAKAAATAQTTFNFLKTGTVFATLVFPAGATVGNWTQAADAIFNVGDILEVDGPATADGSLANIGISLQGFRF
jgi:hypothetical protein